MVFEDTSILLTGRSNPKLASDIAKILKTTAHNPISKFSDGETRVRIPINVRKRDVFIIQSTCPPDVDAYHIELLLMIDAARRASASRIIAVMPYMGYARQDRKEGPRVPVSSALLMETVEFSGANSILVIDLHSEPQEGFIRCPVDNLYGSYTLIPKLRTLKLDNLVIAAADKGGVPMAIAYANFLKAKGVAIVYKERDINKTNVSEALEMIGNVSGKNVILVDDMIDTGGTICNAAELLKKRGAKRIFAAGTHGIFSGNAPKKIKESSIEKFFVTDTVPVREAALKTGKVEVVSVAPLLAEAIKRTESGDSISSLFLK